MEQRSVRVGIGVLIFNDRDKILLGRRVNSHGALTWGPPGGHLEFGESFEECAIREVAEETGLIIKDPKFYAVTNDIFGQEDKHYVSIFMSTTFPIGQTVQVCEPHKIIEWRWFDFENLPENIFLPLASLKKQEQKLNI